MDEIIQKVAIWALPVLLAVTLHEVAHGWAALRFGDHTAQALGRLTLNPIRHVDPVGTILVPLMLVIVSLGAFMFGWAKPVPVDYRNLKNPRKNMIWIAAAGPAANFVMAVLWGWLGHLGASDMIGYFSRPLALMAEAGVVINISLMVLNLLPLPPLDGGRILMGVLPLGAAVKLARIEPYGFFILLGLFATHLIDPLLLPLYYVALNLLTLFV